MLAVSGCRPTTRWASASLPRPSSTGIPGSTRRDSPSAIAVTPKRGTHVRICRSRRAHILVHAPLPSFALRTSFRISLSCRLHSPSVSNVLLRQHHQCRALALASVHRTARFVAHVPRGSSVLASLSPRRSRLLFFNPN